MIINVRHDVGRGHSQLIYGGVHLEPKIQMLDEKDQMGQCITEAAFSRPEQVRVNTDYVVASRKATAEQQGGTEQVGFLYHLRLIEAVEKKMREAQAQGVDIEAVRAGKKASEAMPRGHAETKEDSNTRRPPPATGGRKPPSPPNSPRQKAQNSPRFFAGADAGEQKQGSTPNPNQPSSEYVVNSVAIDARKAIAMSAYNQAGFDTRRSLDHIRGIDFSKPVEFVILPKGTEVIQYMLPEKSPGHYFALIGTTGIKLGIYTSGRIPVTFFATKDIKVLRSTATAITDKYSMASYGWEIQTEGGATQYFSPDINDWRIKR